MASSRNGDDRSASEGRMRLDKWLWVARFFKARQLAMDAINGGKVHVNGQRAKPGKEIGVGAKLRISKDQYIWDITVQALSSQRRPAAEAVLLYEETPESITRRQAEVDRRRDERSLSLQPETRPNKKERRQIHRFKRGTE